MTKLSALLNHLRGVIPFQSKFEGFVHKRTIHHVTGWVRNRANPGERVTVEAVLTAPAGERVLARGTADLYYGLLSLKRGQGVRHGFQLYFDPPLTEAERDAVTVRPAGAARRLKFAEPPQLPPAADTEPAQLPVLQGYIDELSLTGVAGWMMSPRYPARRLDFEVVLVLPEETRIIARGVASEPYPTLDVSVSSDTDYGFRVEFPEKLTILERDNLIVRATAHGIAVARAMEFQGFIDELSTRHVGGWVRSRFRPEVQLEVEAVLTGTNVEAKLAAGVASSFHAGLALGAPDDGHHGFQLRFMQPVDPSQLDAVQIRVVPSNFALPRWLLVADMPGALNPPEVSAPE